MLLVEHGKRCVRCSKNGHPRKEQHGPCPLTNLAAAAKAGHKLSGKQAAEDAEKSLKGSGGSTGMALHMLDDHFLWQSHQPLLRCWARTC